MTTPSIDQEGWVDVADEEIPKELPMTNSGFEIVEMLSLATRKGAPFEDYLCSFKSSVLIDDDNEVELDSNRIRRSSRRRHSRRRCTIIETTMETTIDSSFGVVRRRIRRRSIPAKFEPIGRQTLKFDDHNDAQSSLKFDHEFDRPPYEPPLQQEGDDVTPDQDPKFEALLEGPWKPCYLDEVD